MRGLRPLGMGLAAAVAAAWLFGERVGVWGRAAADGPSIRFSFWGGPDDHAMWGEIIAAFEQSNPDVRITAEWLPISGYRIKLDQQFVAGEAPDVVLFQDESLPRYAESQFVSLDPLVAGDAEARAAIADAWSTARPTFTWNGGLWGMPVMGGGVQVFCNLDAFDRASRVRGERIAPPEGDWTLDDFLETCRRLTIDENGDGQIDQYGFFQPHWMYALPLFWACGAELTNPEATEWTFRGPAALRALTLYQDLRHRWTVTPTPVEYAGQNSDTAFLSGRTAMCVNGPWFMAFLRRTRLGNRYRVVGIPRGPGGSATRATWDGLCLSARRTPQRQACGWRFIRHVLSMRSQQTIARFQRALPVRRSASGEFVAAAGAAESSARQFVDAMHSARCQPVTKEWGLLYQAMTRQVTSLLLEGRQRRSAEQALAALAADPSIHAGLNRPANGN